MKRLIYGTFHFHSVYSHDGKSTLWKIASVLRDQGLSFCVMTEHFEDFSALTFDEYLREVDIVNRRSGFILIPGVEVHLDGIDTILFPVDDYAEISRLISEGDERCSDVVKVVAHPAKYPFDLLTRHLEKYKVNGIELWNQQSDGSLMPALGLLEWMKTQHRRNDYGYFFGCDLHDVTLSVTNVVCLPEPPSPTPAAIASELLNRRFVSRNLSTGIEYRHDSPGTDFDSWVESVVRKPFYRGKIQKAIRRGLRFGYRMLPRDTQHSLNDFKNLVRNRV
jgi:hypothetical protein